MNEKYFVKLNGYYVKDKNAIHKEDSKIGEEVSFLFNPQKKVNESYFTPTTDITPSSSKVYFVKSTNEDFYNNGYMPYSGLSEFESGITYYERSSDFDTISGECFIIKAFGKTIMLDTGGTNRSESIREYLEENNITKIDYLILSHYHYDHCSNLSNMVNYLDFSSCKCYLPIVAPVEDDIQYNTTVTNLLNTLGIEYIYPNELDTLEIDKLKITFYNCGSTAFDEINELYGEEPKKVNDYCMVCLVNYISTNILYSGDIEYIAQERLYNKEFFKDISIDLYKWQHHGVNSLDNVYKPYIDNISPKEVVVVTNMPVNYFNDRNLLNLTPINCCYDKTLEWVSDGSNIKLKKKNKVYTEIKNSVIHFNATPLNNYVGFLKITNAYYYKSCSLIMKISDTQHNRFHSLFEVNFRANNNPTDIDRVNITNINSDRILNTAEILEDLYICTENENVIFYLKKTQNNITPTVSILDFIGQDNITRIEPIRVELTESEFTEKYGTSYFKYNHENKLTMESSFTNYDNSGNNDLRYKKVGNVVEITGSIKNTVDLPTSPEQVIAYLPSEISPKSRDIYIVQQSNATNRWAAHIGWDSTMQCSFLKFSRYGTSSGTTCNTGAFLTVHIIYML